MSSRIYDPKQTGDAGVTLTERAVQRLGWIFRAQPVADYGIDAHIELTDLDKHPTGRLVGVQVKSGQSYLSEESGDAFVFRPHPDHVDYWLNHSLPILVCLVDLESEIVYWQFVTRSTVVNTGVGWKILVPKSNVLEEQAKEDLMEHTRSPVFVQTRTHLAFSRPLMELADSGDLILYSEQWVNKSSGRGAVTFYKVGESDNAYGDEIEPAAHWGMVFSPQSNFWELLPESFPWAALTVDEEYYSIFEDRSVTDMMVGVADLGEDIPGLAPYHLRPYEVASLELARYRYLVDLSEIGQSYLTVERFVENNSVHLPDIM